MQIGTPLLLVTSIVFGLASHVAGAFPLKTQAIECSGHEALTELALDRVHFPERLYQSVKLGVRYVDHGGYPHCGIGSKLDSLCANKCNQHFHFLIRNNEGGKQDVVPLIRDATARIKQLFQDALRTPATATQHVRDMRWYGEFPCYGNAGMDTYTVTTRYFLIGAALHTIQDSFAHTRRTPAWKGDIDPIGDLSAEQALATYERGGIDKMYHGIVNAAHWPHREGGSEEHGAIYSRREGGAVTGNTDNPWNPPLSGYHCGATRTHEGNLTPVALAAVRASADFVERFRQAERGGDADRLIDGFMETWYSYEGKFPGYGNPNGKICDDHDHSLREVIPGESLRR